MKLSLACGMLLYPKFITLGSWTLNWLRHMKCKYFSAKAVGREGGTSCTPVLATRND